MSTNKLWNDENLKLLHEWWEWLDEARGERAKLRHCQTLLEICFQPAYVRLCQKLLSQKLSQFNKEKLAIIAGILAHVETETDQKIAAQMSAPKNSAGNKNQAPPTFSETRFRRLIACDSSDELFSFLRRAVAILDKKINIEDLATSICFWNDSTKKRWVYAYYENIEEDKKD